METKEFAIQLLLTYLPAEYCVILFICMTAFPSLLSGYTPKNCHVAAFIHIITNVLVRFDGVTVLHFYVRFLCFDNKSKYGKTHQLSTLMSPFRIFMVANLPPSFADFLLYKRYLSFLACIQFITAFTNEIHLH